MGGPVGSLSNVSSRKQYAGGLGDAQVSTIQASQNMRGSFPRKDCGTATTLVCALAMRDDRIVLFDGSGVSREAHAPF